MYGELIERLFITPGDRQREIERLCDEGHSLDKSNKPIRPFPNYGYAVLSSLMCQEAGRFNVALTTNFDDLLVDSFFYFRKKERPLVIHHDSLAPFIRPTHSRPLIVKLHGDHRLSPRNTILETSSLDKLVSQRVSTVLHDRGLIFIGYGGNDESILAMLDDLPEEALPFGVYWISSNEPSGLFRPWLEHRRATWVPSDDFDEMMCRLGRHFDIDDPDDHRFQVVLSRYSQTKMSTLFRIAEKSSASDSDPTLCVALANILRNIDTSKAGVLYERALTGAPENAAILSDCATFQWTKLKDLKKAESLFKQAIDADGSSSEILCNYAVFLEKATNNRSQAVEYFTKAVEMDGSNATVLGRYAAFLSSDRSSADLAESLYSRAMECDPRNSFNMLNYAAFCSSRHTDTEKAEALFKRAIEVDSKNADALARYASFLHFRCKRTKEARECFKNAFEVDSRNATLNSQYAVFLSSTPQGAEDPEVFHRRAIDEDPDSPLLLLRYATYLSVSKSNYEAAEEMFKRSLQINPFHAPTLSAYARFLRSRERDPVVVREYFERAVNANPFDADSLGAFANFLREEGADLPAAERMYQLALQNDPDHSENLGQYAVYVAIVKKDIPLAVSLLRRATDLAPEDIHLLCNFAACLFIVGHKDEGVKLILKARELLSPTDGGQFDIATAFHLYLSDVPERRQTWLRKIRQLVDENKFASGWSFDSNVEKAISERHSDENWLRRLCSVVVGEEKAAGLSKWKKWQMAGAT